jgi:hypothetical protein
MGRRWQHEKDQTGTACRATGSVLCATCPDHGIAFDYAEDRRLHEVGAAVLQFAKLKLDTACLPASSRNTTEKKG